MIKYFSSLNNTHIAIIGGTGTFGKNAVRKLIKNVNFKKLIIFSRSEINQYHFAQELSQKKKLKNVEFILGDIRNYDSLKYALQKIDIVIHSAAMKHIKACEHNPQEAIKTNIDGTKNVIKACNENKIKKAILISTDKAVKPINLYGASKLISERLFLKANQDSKKLSLNTKYSILRFGNVLGSSGSVIQNYANLISKRQNILPISDLKATRFFLDIDALIIFSFKMLEQMLGGEIFVPFMPSAFIADLGKAISEDIKYKEIGLEFGEKLHESLFSKAELKNIFEVSENIKNNNKDIKKYYLQLPLSEQKYSFKKSKNLSYKKLPADFEYSSNKNKNWLKGKELKKAILAVI